MFETYGKDRDCETTGDHPSEGILFPEQETSETIESPHMVEQQSGAACRDDGGKEGRRWAVKDVCHE